MYFKLEYTIRQFVLPKNEVLIFDIEDAHTIHIEIRAPTDDEQKMGFEKHHALCISETQIDPSKKNQAVFAQIENNKIPAPGDECRLSYKDQYGNEICLPSINKFPPYFRSFIEQVNKELSEAIRLVINIVRWRANILGPHNPISTRGLSWSRDKQFWHPSPSYLTLRVSTTSHTLHLSSNAKEDIRNLVREKNQEPVHHELFRESWEQKDTNPRSSLILGISSLEVAMKWTIGTLVPSASWLTQNMPVPPVDKLLGEYLPKLPTVNKINNKVLSPPERLMDLIKKGITIRNQIVHVGGKAPNYNTLDHILDAICDIIWMLDYYCGYNWAYDCISTETKCELENPTPTQTPPRPS